MQRKPISIDIEQYPEQFRPLLQKGALYDSSCSPIARVYYIDKDCGYYLKRSPEGSLEKEVAMTRYFYSKGLSARVVEYLSDGGYDWMLTERVKGEDCTHADHLANPQRLCDTIATHFRELHEKDSDGCPVSDRMS